MHKLGEGTFGRVIECWDRQRKEYCAIKIIRNVRKYRNAAKVELEVLKKLRENDKDDSRHCVRLTDWFDYRNHICMVFERLGLSLYDFLLRLGTTGLSPSAARVQCLCNLQHSKHSRNLKHHLTITSAVALLLFFAALRY